MEDAFLSCYVIIDNYIRETGRGTLAKKNQGVVCWVSYVELLMHQWGYCKRNGDDDEFCDAMRSQFKL